MMHYPKNRHESVPWFLLFCGVVWCCGNGHGGGSFFVAAAPLGTGEDDAEAAPMVYDDAEDWPVVYDDDDESYGDTSRIVGGNPVTDGNKHSYFGT